VLLAHWLRLAGDTSLASFATTEGLFGSESGHGPPKSISTVVRTELQIVDGQLGRYFKEPWKAKQKPREATRLGRTESRYMNAGKTLDNHHTLGLLLGEGTLSDLPIRSVILRDTARAGERMRGEHGNRMATGYGVWQDVFGALPAVLLLK
jgi:hypothetical protein